MINIITNTVKNKYFTYVPGEFMPIVVDGELANKRAFHAYKLRRAHWKMTHLDVVYHHYTNQRG